MHAKHINLLIGSLVIVAGLIAGGFTYSELTKEKVQTTAKEERLQALRAQGVMVENYHLLLDDSQQEISQSNVTKRIGAAICIFGLSCGFVLIYRGLSQKSSID